MLGVATNSGLLPELHVACMDGYGQIVTTENEKRIRVKVIDGDGVQMISGQ